MPHEFVSDPTSTTNSITSNTSTMGSIQSSYVSQLTAHISRLTDYPNSQSKVAMQVSATIPADYASSLNVVYFPQLGEILLGRAT